MEVAALFDGNQIRAPALGGITPKQSLSLPLNLYF
jgi:hypothetical protein